MSEKEDSFAGRPRNQGGAPAFVAAAVLLLAGCGFPYIPEAEPQNVREPEPVFENPPTCESAVEEHRREPQSLGRMGPEPRRMILPPIPEPGPVTVHLVVDERGRVVAESVEISGAELATTRRELQESSEEWTFEPARIDGCWVPARFHYAIRRPE